jgi:glycosyltransferase involved in cell wall biosynthesis
MKIAYFAHWNLCKESGVLKKILAQINDWTRAGHQVRLFAASPGGELWGGVRSIQLEHVISPRFRAHLFKTRQLVRRVSAWQPDLIYLRFSYYYPGMERLGEIAPLVAEINSDDVAEYSISRDKHLYLYHRCTRSMFLDKVNGFVCLTNEIAQKYARFSGEKVVIANSIDLSQFSPLPPPDNPQPTLIFLGTPDHAWHGVDKIHWLANQRPEWQFHLIGMNGPVSEKAPTNLVYHGFLSRSEYESLLAVADVAIGTLALHRKHMHEACPIKVREYLAYGLPTIIGYQDIDFPVPVPFLLQLPNVSENIQEHLDQIDGFVSSWKGKRVERSQISQIDLTVKERMRMSFMEKFLP